MTAHQVRDMLVDALRVDLIGPSSGRALETEILERSDQVEAVAGLQG